MIELSFEDNATSYRPSETVSGRARWSVESESPLEIEIWMGWSTDGKGTEDVEVVESVLLKEQGRFGETFFQFPLPIAPYSFSGKLVSLTWFVEGYIKGREDFNRQSFILTPTGTEIMLGTSKGDEKSKRESVLHLPR